MTNEDVLRMAKEAAETDYAAEGKTFEEVFARLIRAATLEEAARMAEWCNENYLEHQTIDKIRQMRSE